MQASENLHTLRPRAFTNEPFFTRLRIEMRKLLPCPVWYKLGKDSCLKLHQRGL